MVYFLLSINTKCYKERHDYWIKVLVLIKSKVAHYKCLKDILKNTELWKFYQNTLLNQKFNKPIRIPGLLSKRSLILDLLKLSPGESNTIMSLKNDFVII